MMFTLCILFSSIFLLVENIEISVVSLNDFHARFDETNDAGSACYDTANCIGGFSRAYSQINNLLNDNPDTILLNAGDNFQGTMWYNTFKWNVTQYFLNKIPWDAIVLGNHEFDDGIAGVVPFIKSLKAPVITCNIDDSLEPDIQGIYGKSVVVERNGKKIGIIGVIIKTTNQISDSGKLKFFDESAAVNAEAERLVAEENVFTNIVLSHSGYDVDQLIAQNASSKIGLIVGGHSHTFLYTGDTPPGSDIPAGEFPTIVERLDGNNVLIIQASAYCKYLSNLTVTYDEDGNVISWSGEPIFLSTDLPQDDGINEELQPWKDVVDQQALKVIGETLVRLDNDNCYATECLIGNFVTDTMVYSYTDLADDDTSWTYASIALFNAGGLRAAIERGNITYGDMMTAQPFENTFDVGEIQGQYIKDAFERTTEQYYYGRAYSSLSLLQVSGLQVTLNLTRPQGSRVQSIKVRCKKCLIPIYEDLDVGQNYRLILPSFLAAGGGDGFTMLSDNFQNRQIGRRDIDVFVDYLSEKSPVFEEIGRLEIIGESYVSFKNIHS